MTSRGGLVGSQAPGNHQTRLYLPLEASVCDRQVSTESIARSCIWTPFLKMSEWQNGLCGCFNNCHVCICTYFLPCYVHGKNAEAVGESCGLCTLGFFVPLANLYFLTKIRGKVRESKGIEGGVVGDCFMSLCCTFCTLAQEAQEVNSLGGAMAQEIEREWGRGSDPWRCLQRSTIPQISGTIDWHANGQWSRDISFGWI